MTKLKNVLSSPGKIAIFALCVILVAALLAFAGIKAGAAIMNNQGIGLDQATQIALKNAGFEESEVSLLRGHFDRDDGLSTYDIEFRGSDNFDYDYLISADDGTIIEANREYADILPDQTAPSEDSLSETPQAETPQSETPQAETPQNGGQTSGGLIGVEKAKSIAASDAGLTVSQVNFVKAYQDYDDGIYVYEVEFISGDLEYEYEIHGTSGTIMDKDVDSIYD